LINNNEYDYDPVEGEWVKKEGEISLRTGQYVCARKVVRELKLIPEEKLLYTTDEQVLELLKKKFVFCVEYSEREHCESIMLIPKEDVAKYHVLKR
jgi:hypothetical protein